MLFSSMFFKLSSEFLILREILQNKSLVVKSAHIKDILKLLNKYFVNPNPNYTLFFLYSKMKDVCKLGYSFRVRKSSKNLNLKRKYQILNMTKFLNF